MKKSLLFVFLLVVPFSLFVSAQCSMVEVPLSQRVQESTLIIEGKVTSTRSFWNTAHGNIFTSNHIEVSKIFKGTLPSGGLEIITEGGVVGNQMEKLDPGFSLSENEEGIFFCYPNNLEGLNPGGISGTKFRPYADAQGFIRYHADYLASDPFAKYSREEDNLFHILTHLTKHSFTSVASPSSPASSGPSPLVPAVAPTITNFSPAVIAAGTFAVLTINGTNFGATQGTSTVRFQNADDGGASVISLPTIATVSWSATQIQVQMVTDPGVPGTGTFQVVTSGGTANSPSSLTVSYAEMNLTSGGVIYQTSEVNQSGGGYVWKKFTSFATNAPAVASFQRALDSWRCGTNINWTISASTTAVNTAALDGTNVIRFDVGSELPAGVLGRCTSYWSGCTLASVTNYYVSELDIVFDDATNWQYGPANPGGAQSDFESVALHELGHGHQFNHSISNTDVMNYALTTGTTRRVPSSDNLNAGNDVMSRSETFNACSQSPMIVFVGAVANAGTNATVACGANATIGSATTSGHTYLWSPTTGLTSSTVSNPTAHPITTTTYTVTETVTATGCTGTDFVTVTVNPIVANAGLSASICSGANVTIGTVNIAGHTYSWSPTTNLSSSTVSNPTAHPTGTTVYTVTETVTASGCTAKDTVTITVGSFVSNGGASATVCSGSSTTVGGASVAGHTYSWSPTTGLSSSTVSNPTASPTATTVYTVTETITASGCIGIDTVTVTVPTFVSNAGANVTTCAGVGVLIGATAVGGHTYLWSPTTGLSSSTASSPTASPAGTTTYTMTETNTSTGCTSKDSVTVAITTYTANFNASPLSGSAPLLVSFHDSSTNATSWDWDINNDGVSDYATQNPTHSYTIPGTYTVKLKVNNNCSNKVRTGYIVVGATGISSVNSPEFSVLLYPNPFTESATLVVNSSGIKPDAPLIFTLYDILGQEVRKEFLPHAQSQNEFFIGRSELAGALYFYEVRSGEQLLGKGKLVIY